MVASQTATACNPGQGTGQCGGYGAGGVYYNNINDAHASYRQGGNGGSSGPWYFYYLGMALDKNDTPYFFRKKYTAYSFGDEEFDGAKNELLNECNRSTERAPCRYAQAVTGVNACIAYLSTPKTTFSLNGEGWCRKAKQTIIKDCMATYNDKNICRNVKDEPTRTWVTRLLN